MFDKICGTIWNDTFQVIEKVIYIKTLDVVSRDTFTEVHENVVWWPDEIFYCELYE